jgi:universal stress protein E
MAAMNPIHTILAIVDPTSQQQPAVTKAAVLAEKCQARLDLFICDTKAAKNARVAELLRESPRARLDANLSEMLDALAAPLRRRGIDVTTEVISADPLHTALVERVQRTCADLVVKDTHHHSIAQRTFLTNTDWELIRGCPVPLLLVKPTAWSPAHRIAAAVDPGHADDKPRLLDTCILNEASRLAQQFNGELHAIHAYIPASVIAAAVAQPPVVVDVPLQALAAEREARLKEVCALTAEYRLPPTSVHVEAGGAKEVLSRVAQQCEIDVMVMGAVSRSALKRIVIGSTAESVLEHLPCDLMVVKSPNFAELLPL